MSKKKKMLAEAPRGPGRPTIRTPEIEEEVLAWISSGRTLREFCRLPGKPARETFDLWRRSDSAFHARFARARELGFDEIAEETLEIADTPVIGISVTEDTGEKGGTKTTREDALGHRKLQVETRLKLLAKWDPKRFGDKLGIGQADGLEPVQMTNAERAERIKAILEAARKSKEKQK